MTFCSLTLRDSSRFFTMLAFCLARLAYVCGWGLFLSVGLPQIVTAAEIGNIRVLSHIGQPLLAEIDLAAITPEDANNLQVKLALPDVYRLGNIRRNPVLNNVRLQVRQNEQRYTVIMQSTQAIFDGYLNIYLELKDSKGQEVRALTLWLEPDPERPIPEQIDTKETLPHPDGDLAESAAPVAHPLIATPRSMTPKTAKSLPPAMSEAELAGARAPRVNPLPQAAPANCAKQLRNLQEKAGQCELVAIENQRIAGHIDTLESKVDILKRVILAEDAAPIAPIAPNAVVAPLPEVKRKNPKAAQTVIPWKIIGISTAVFVAVAILAFVGLTLLSKRMAKKKGKVAIKPSSAQSAQSVQPVAPATLTEDASTAAENPAPAPSKPMGKMAKIKHAVHARTRAVLTKLTQPFSGMKAKLRGIWSAMKAKLPRKKAANSEKAAEPA